MQAAPTAKAVIPRRRIYKKKKNHLKLIFFCQLEVFFLCFSLCFCFRARCGSVSLSRGTALLPSGGRKADGICACRYGFTDAFLRGTACCNDGQVGVAFAQNPHYLRRACRGRYIENRRTCFQTSIDVRIFIQNGYNNGNIDDICNLRDDIVRCPAHSPQLPLPRRLRHPLQA